MGKTVSVLFLRLLLVKPMAAASFSAVLIALIFATTAPLICTNRQSQTRLQIPFLLVRRYCSAAAAPSVSCCVGSRVIAVVRSCCEPVSASDCAGCSVAANAAAASAAAAFIRRGLHMLLRRAIDTRVLSFPPSTPPPHVRFCRAQTSAAHALAALLRVAPRAAAALVQSELLSAGIVEDLQVMRSLPSR